MKEHQFLKDIDMCSFGMLIPLDQGGFNENEISRREISHTTENISCWYQNLDSLICGHK